MRLYDGLSLMLGSANLVLLAYNFIAYARYAKYGIPHLGRCLTCIVLSFAQGSLAVLCMLLPGGSMLFAVTLLLLVLSVLINAVLAQLIIGIVGGRSRGIVIVKNVLYLLPLVMAALAATAPLHGLLLRGVVKASGTLGYVLETGPLYTPLNVLSKLTVVAAFVVMMITYSKNSSINLASVLLIFVSVSVPTATDWIDGLFLARYGDFNNIGMLMYWAPITAICYVYFGSLNTARRNAIEHMHEAYAVYDNRGHCVDANIAYEEFSLRHVGSARAGLRTLSSVMDVKRILSQDEYEFEIMDGTRRKYYTAHPFNISDGINRNCGNGILFRETTSIRERIKRLDTLASNDGLTGAGNRRMLYDRAADILLRAAQDGRPITMLMFDIDHFKIINDTYGHPVGDEVLVALCRICEENMRRDDLLIRYGGEEFIVLCENMTREAGVALATRLHAAIGGKPIATKAGAIPVAVSIGGCTFDTVSKEGIDRWIDAADRALYRAKRTGRDKVVYASPAGEIEGEL